MKKDIELYEQIEKYLTGNLSGEEKLAFERQISSNPEIELALENNRQLANLIEESTLLEIRDSIQNIHNQNPGGKGRGFSGKKAIFFSAIIVVTAIFISTLFFNRSNRNNSDTLVPQVPIVDSTSNEKDIDENRRVAENNSVNPKKPVKSEGTTKNQIKPENEVPEPISTAVPKTAETTYDKEKKAKAKSPDIPDSIMHTSPALPQPPIEDKAPLPISSRDSVDCDTVQISADIQTDVSCEERATGKISIWISSMKGAEPPLSYSIDNGKNFKYESQLVDLLPGNYIVWLKDKNNCLTKAGSYLIGSIICDYEFIFAPDKGERWEIPTKNQNGTIKIYTRQGTLVFTQLFEEGEIIEWDGSSQNGIPQSMGVYRFILEIKNEEPIFGNVTIVR